MNPPELRNITPNATVHTPALLVFGRYPDAPASGTVTVFHHLNLFPPQTYPVTGSYFKALVRLEPGYNDLTFRYSSASSSAAHSVSSASGSAAGSELRLPLTYIPLVQNPPIHLCLILGKDSPGTFDAPPRPGQPAPDLSAAIRKTRMAGYLMQAFTAEQMRRHGLGPRVFRFSEEYTRDTTSAQFAGTAPQTSTIKVHVIRSATETVASIRDPNVAQQNKKATQSGRLFEIAMAEVRQYFGPENLPVNVACIFLDAHWDPKQQLITGHAALGGGTSDVRLAIFGSHGMHSWPENFESVTSAFTNATPTDTKYVANDCGDGGTTWECLTVTLGAFMHEIGHLLGSPHQPSGVMLRDYVRLNRTFVVAESKSAKSRQPGKPLCLPSDECAWHRLDALRFWAHPAFALPTDQPNVRAVCGTAGSAAPAAYPGGSVRSVGSSGDSSPSIVFKSPTGIYLIEVAVGGTTRGHLEFLPPAYGGRGVLRQVAVTEESLRGAVAASAYGGPSYSGTGGPLAVRVFSFGGGNLEVPDFRKRVAEGVSGQFRDSFGDICSGRQLVAFRSSMAGQKTELAETQTATFNPYLVRQVVFHAGLAVDGVEFVLSSGQRVLFGKRGGRPSVFALQDGEIVAEFQFRSGQWVDAVAVRTSFGRHSGWHGGNGGGVTVFEPPEGYLIGGLYGKIGRWCESAGIVYFEL